MALATVVATDETQTPDADLKVRYVFEPAAPGNVLMCGSRYYWLSDDTVRQSQ